MTSEKRAPSTGFCIEAHDKEINGALVPPLLDLVDRRLIRIIDVLILVKRGEGDFDALTTSDLDADQVGDLGALAGASSGLLSDDDAAEAASVMQANSIGLLIVYENLWSVPFAVAAREAGGHSSAKATSLPRPSWPRSTRSSPDERKLSCLDFFVEWPALPSWRVLQPPSAIVSRVVRPIVGPSRTISPPYAEPQYAQQQYVQAPPPQAAPHRAPMTCSSNSSNSASFTTRASSPMTSSPPRKREFSPPNRSEA